jgi:hypothetical protein
MVDLLVLTSLDQLLLILQRLYAFYKTSYLNEVNRTEPSPLVCVSCLHLHNTQVKDVFSSFKYDEIFSKLLGKLLKFFFRKKLCFSIKVIITILI